MIDATPPWMKEMDGVENPFVDEHGVDRKALRLREMSLPPQYRLKHRRADLRDAYLARFLLHDAMRGNMPIQKKGWDRLLAIAQRENGRAQLAVVIRDIEKTLHRNEIDEIKEIARVLFSFTMHEQRARAARRIK